MSNAFTTKTRDHGRREWKCKGECCKNPKFLNASDKGKWNRASKLECQECAFLPNKTCPLWGDGLGVNGGKWKVDNHIAPDTQLPSKQTAVGKAATDKKAADNKQLEKVRKDNEALRKDLEALRKKTKQDADAADREPRVSGADRDPRDSRDQPKAELKTQLTNLEKRERKLKGCLDEEADRELFEQRLATVRSEITAVKTKMQQDMCPAKIVQESTRNIENMEKELVALDSKLPRTHDILVKADESWRAVGVEIKEKRAKLAEQRSRQQEALGRSQRPDTSKLNLDAIQSMFTVMADIARASADQGLCGDDERQNLGTELQRLHQVAQTLAMFQGKLQTRAQPPGGTNVAALVQAHEARTSRPFGTATAELEESQQRSLRFIQWEKDEAQRTAAAAAAPPAQQQQQQQQVSADAAATTAAGNALLQQQQQQLQAGKEGDVARLSDKQREQTQLLLQVDDEQRAKQLQQSQEQILQSQGPLRPLDSEEIARNSSQAVAAAYGGIHQPQPDIPRRHWGDMQGDEADPENLWGCTQGEPPQQTDVPPIIRAAQHGLLLQAQQEQADEQMAAALRKEQQNSTEPPVEAAGSKTTDQMLADMDKWPKRYVC